MNIVIAGTRLAACGYSAHQLDARMHSAGSGRSGRRREETHPLSGSMSDLTPQPPLAAFVLLEAEPALWLGPGRTGALTVPHRAMLRRRFHLSMPADGRGHAS
jgi:hypothetical protein